MRVPHPHPLGVHYRTDRGGALQLLGDVCLKSPAPMREPSDGAAAAAPAEIKLEAQVSTRMTQLDYTPHPHAHLMGSTACAVALNRVAGSLPFGWTDSCSAMGVRCRKHST